MRVMSNDGLRGRFGCFSFIYESTLKITCDLCEGARNEKSVILVRPVKPVNLCRELGTGLRVHIT